MATLEAVARAVGGETSLSAIEGLIESLQVRGCIVDGFEDDAGLGKAMADLPPFLRSLLITDGTVTKTLEAYFWEPVQVQVLKQQELRITERIDALAVFEVSIHGPFAIICSAIIEESRRFWRRPVTSTIII